MYHLLLLSRHSNYKALTPILAHDQFQISHTYKQRDPHQNLKANKMPPWNSHGPLTSESFVLCQEPVLYQGLVGIRYDLQESV